MKQNLANTANRANRLLTQLGSEKKKTILALCLITFMALMWVRVLTRKAPNAASAALMAQQNHLEYQENSKLKISFIELPKIPGRNDVITRDIFDSNGWRGFVSEGKNLADGEEVDVVPRSLSLGSRLIRAQLMLEAIELGQNPHAFINGRLLSVGDKLILKDRANTYECEVVRIEENAVFISCGEVEVRLKLTPVIEVID